MIDAPESIERQLAQARDRFALQDYYGAIHLLRAGARRGVRLPRRASPDGRRLRAARPAGARARRVRCGPRAQPALPRGDDPSRARAGRARPGGRGDADAAPGGRDHAAAGRRASRRRSPPSWPTACRAGAGVRGGGRARPRHRASTGARSNSGPRFHDLRYRLGRLLLEAGQVLEARDVLSALVAAHPHFVDAQAALGLSCYLSGDTAEAQRVWRECLATRPASARIEAYLSMVERART